MANKAFEKWLSKKEEVVKEQLKESSDLGNFDFDDGTYIGLFTLNKAQQDKNDNWGVLINLLIVDGERSGDTYSNWNNLEREEGFKWYGWHLKNAGVTIDPDEVYDAIKSNPDDICDLVANQVVAKFQLKTTKSKKDGQERSFQNMTIVKVLEDFPVDDEILTLKKERDKKRKEREESKSSNKEEKDDEPKAKEKVKEEAKTEAVEDEMDIAEGMEIKFVKKINKKDVEMQGTIIGIDEDAGTVKVKVDDDDYTIKVDGIVEIIDKKETV